ncbi:MAG: hypothetical protein EOO17_04500 [Chloroflexi bacterium]|nr:MAG: hypothetical protein EOO17_04500 [Chloroflexota bacterium]
MYPQIAPELRGLWRQERLVITRDRVFTGQGLRQSIEPLNDADAGIIARLVWLLRGHDPSRDTQFQRLEAELLEQREARNLARLKIADWFEQFEVDQRAITQLHWSCKWSECIAMVRLTAERAGHQLSI